MRETYFLANMPQFSSVKVVCMSWITESSRATAFLKSNLAWVISSTIRTQRNRSGFKEVTFTVSQWPHLSHIHRKARSSIPPDNSLSSTFTSSSRRDKFSLVPCISVYGWVTKPCFIFLQNLTIQILT